MNPYQAPRAELFWMTPEERAESWLRLSARRWGAAAAVAGTLAVALAFRPDPAFLLLHGFMALVALGGGAGLAAWGSSHWLQAPWPRWILHVLLLAAGIFALGLAGIATAAAALAWIHHPAPLGPLGAAGPRALPSLLAAGLSFTLAGCGMWAVAWRWRLERGPRRY